MATWASTTQTSAFDAEQYARTAMDARGAARSGASVGSSFGQQTGLFGSTSPFLGGNPGTTAQNLSGYSVVGINAAEVPKMRDAIRNAVSNIQAHIEGIEEHTNSSNAFRSDDVKAAVENYVVAVKDYCKALISDLLAFSDKLQSVHDAWLASTGSYASDSIGGSTGSVSDNATYYTEQL